jgi:hypothetical protein
MPYRSTNPYPAAFTDSHSSADMRAWRDMHAIAQHAIMIDSRASVYDAALAEYRAGVDDGSSHDNRPSPQLGARTYAGSGMNHRRNLIAHPHECFQAPNSGAVLTNGDK